MLLFWLLWDLDGSLGLCKNTRTLGPLRPCDTAAVELYGLHYVVFCVCFVRMRPTHVEICAHATILLLYVLVVTLSFETKQSGHV